MTTPELEFTEVFLRRVHPQKRGWMLWRDLHIGTFTLDHVFHKENGYTLIVLYMDGPSVSKTDLNRAVQIQQICSEKFNATKVRVFLIYGKLLHPAGKLPKGVSVMSVMSVMSEKEDARPGSHCDACLN